MTFSIKVSSIKSLLLIVPRVAVTKERKMDLAILMHPRSLVKSAKNLVIYPTSASS